MLHCRVKFKDIRLLLAGDQADPTSENRKALNYLRDLKPDPSGFFFASFRDLPVAIVKGWKTMLGVQCIAMQFSGNLLVAEEIPSALVTSEERVPGP
jgi:hypothetical protein